MPQTLQQLATLISTRDSISYEEATQSIEECRIEMESAFYHGDLFEVEDILKFNLNLEPDYLFLFID